MESLAGQAIPVGLARRLFISAGRVVTCQAGVQAVRGPAIVMGVGPA
jgi:hypothetical protein